MPVAHNAGDFWPRRGLLKKPGRIRVVIGPPIEATGRDPRELNAEVQTWIEGTMQNLRSVPDASMSIQSTAALQPVAVRRVQTSRFET